MAALAALFALCAPHALAAGPENPVRAEVADTTVPAGGDGRLSVQVVIPEGYHVFSDVLEVQVVDAGGLAVGAASYPGTVTIPDPMDRSRTRQAFEGVTIVDLPVRAPADAAGDRPLSLLARFQACKEGLCFPTKEDALDAVVHVVAGTLVPPAQAQDPATELAVVFSGVPGAPGTATVHVDLQGEWHINKAFVSFALPEGSPYTLGEASLPPGEKTGSEADFTAREDYTHDLDLVVPISGPDGEAEVAIDVGYQACKGVSLCRMPTTETVKVPVRIGGAGAAAGVATSAGPSAAPGVPATPVSASPPPDDGSGFAAAAQRGAWALILLCFMAGVGVSFTPCVLPMVPITLGLIGARGAASRMEAVSKSGTYVLGQAIVYTVLGVLAGTSGQLFGSQMQNPWLVGGIAAFFVVMGASMFGLFDLQVPSAIQSRVSGYSERGTYVAAFVYGTIGAVLAGPCSGPVVFAIMGVIASSGNVAFGALLMFAFALGMGMIFLVAGAAAGWLPQRGAWMMFVKKSFGVVMWLGAIYYARSLLTDTQAALLTAAVLLGTAVFGWPHADDGEGFVTTRIRQLYGIVAGIVGAYLVLGTLVSEGFILPPVRFASAGGGAATASAGIPWVRTEAEAITAASSTGKLMMIDFTAEWCAACHEMERETYTDPAVVAEAGGFVTAMIDCTEDKDPVIKAIQKKYGVTGLPTVVFATADGRVVDFTVGFVPAEQFVARMRRAREAAG